MDLLVLHPHTCHPLDQQVCYRLCIRLGWCLRFTVNISITGEQWLSHTHIAHSLEQKNILLWVLFKLNFWPCIYFNPKDSSTMSIFFFFFFVVLMLVNVMIFRRLLHTLEVRKQFKNGLSFEVQQPDTITLKKIRQKRWRLFKIRRFYFWSTALKLARCKVENQSKN